MEIQKDEVVLLLVTVVIVIFNPKMDIFTEIYQATQNMSQNVYSPNNPFVKRT